MRPKEVNMNNGKISKDLGEIGKLNCNEDGCVGLEKHIGELEIESAKVTKTWKSTERTKERTGIARTIVEN